jgi:hypothetical protein
MMQFLNGNRGSLEKPRSGFVGLCIPSIANFLVFSICLLQYLGARFWGSAVHATRNFGKLLPHGNGVVFSDQLLFHQQFPLQLQLDHL